MIASMPEKQDIQGFVMLERQRDFVLWLQQHDASIRNQTLDDIDKAIIEQIDCHDCRIALVRIINSFRQSISTTGSAPR